VHRVQDSLRIALLAATGVALHACSSATEHGASDGGATADVGRDGISCVAVFDCAASCADAACEQACAARGSSSASASFDAYDGYAQRGDDFATEVRAQLAQEATTR